MIDLVQEIGDNLKSQNMMISTAESLTGGLLSSQFCEISGSSEWFAGGIVCYQDEIKEMLGVEKSFMETNGAVNCKTAYTLAKNIALKFNTEIGVSLTGIAGPSTDSKNTPVGTVHIGFYSEKDSECKKFCFNGTRNQIRKKSVQEAMNMILNKIK
ncbi:competence protein ComA [bacterium]|nr:competence protein ComA [bacterium]|tara:strand:- start:33779 stop:34246 length:468 start_codon:yes stop_codon:yes gene_type:complete